MIARSRTEIRCLPIATSVATTPEDGQLTNFRVGVLCAMAKWQSSVHQYPNAMYCRRAPIRSKVQLQAIYRLTSFVGDLNPRDRRSYLFPKALLPPENRNFTREGTLFDTRLSAANLLFALRVT